MGSQSKSDMRTRDTLTRYFDRFRDKFFFRTRREIDDVKGIEFGEIPMEETVGENEPFQAVDSIRNI